MSGVTKKIFQRDILDIKSMWNEQLKSIQNILPKDYSESDIVRLLKEYYPHEWDSVEFKYQYYQIKDKHLKKKQKKSRYNMNKPEQLLRSLPKYRQIISNKSVYSKNYSEETANEFREKLSKKRIPKIERVNRKIELAKAKTQKVEPEFLDKMIGMYDKKNTSLKDKVYILNELKKYYNPKIIKFFFKKNDTELNKQLRIMAFKHLQSFNYNPRLRSNKYMVVHAGNKKRKHYLKNIYPNERYDIPKTPHELEYRINNGMEQRIKTFDFFISHSFRDYEIIQKLIDYENEKGKNIFCDWINDADYLKRHLLCEDTLKVLKKRMDQSKALLFVDSNNSRESDWCKYELNYFKSLGKPMYVITLKNIVEDCYSLTPFEDKWYYDIDYNNCNLY